ncbi:hypothetical protein SDC9_146224 [bioreactor metagenome]|uniref:Uncharacterized protein n=1 Tax=bioreactor metagenome TaxID=1076179 RepID=A0A645EAG8_9ZZZZ
MRQNPQAEPLCFTKQRGQLLAGISVRAVSRVDFQYLYARVRQFAQPRNILLKRAGHFHMQAVIAKHPPVRFRPAAANALRPAFSLDGAGKIDNRCRSSADRAGRAG